MLPKLLLLFSYNTTIQYWEATGTPVRLALAGRCVEWEGTADGGGGTHGRCSPTGEAEHSWLMLKKKRACHTENQCWAYLSLNRCEKSYTLAGLFLSVFCTSDTHTDTENPSLIPGEKTHHDAIQFHNQDQACAPQGFLKSHVSRRQDVASPTYVLDVAPRKKKKFRDIICILRFQATDQVDFWRVKSPVLVLHIHALLYYCFVYLRN